MTTSDDSGAQGEHAPRLALNTADDFNNEITVKTNTIEVLRNDLDRLVAASRVATVTAIRSSGSGPGLLGRRRNPPSRHGTEDTLLPPDEHLLAVLV